MLTGRLVIECADQAEADAIAEGPIDVQVVALESGVPGELLSTQLQPLRVEALSIFAAVDPPDERKGPLVRVYLRRPDKET